MLQIMRSRKPELKPLLFSTTVRNPERIKDYVKIISNYQGKVLNNDIIMKIIADIIKNKLYYTQKYEQKNKQLWEIYNSDKEFSDEQVQDIIINSPQEHKEAGFDKGWPSRFDTIFKIIKEFGFIYYEINKPIEISQTGQLLINSIVNSNPELEEQAFLNSLVKYQRVNPFRKVLNENAPFTLLLKVLKTKVLIADPLNKIMYIEKKEFLKIYSDIALTFDENNSYFKAIFKNKVLIIRLLIYTLLLALLSLLFSYSISFVINKNGLNSNLYMIGIIYFLFIGIFKSVISYARNIYSIQFRGIIDRLITIPTIKHFFDLPYNYYQQS